MNSAAPRNIVVCSDGTWQKGGQATPTNVWRTYLAVREENQVKLYDDGVGSSGAQIIRYFQGAVGYGISRNIIELLTALMDAYRPGDKIFFFGFSRGAFTVRVIADLICLLGIPNAQKLSPSQIEERATDLLDAYKRLNRKRKRIKSQEDFDQQVVQLRRDLNCHDAQGDFDVHFIGCWDTVEAVGLPTDQIMGLDLLKNGMIEVAFPLRFSDQHPSKRVRHLYHALCLDDERHTFHPLLWHSRPEPVKGQTLEQVWFPGGHAHVGGGYAKDQLALTSLEWMLEKAEQAGLDIDSAQRATYLSQAYRQGALHASRPGFYKFYRYRPRRLSELFRANKKNTLNEDLKECRVHASVLDRIAHKTAGYAPTAIDVDFKVVETATYDRPEDDDFLRDRTVAGKFHNTISEANRHVSTGNWLYFVCTIYWLLFIGYCIYASVVHGAMLTPPRPIFSWLNSPLGSMVCSAEHGVLQTVKAMVPQGIAKFVFPGLLSAPGLFTAFILIFKFGLLGYGRKLRRMSQAASLKAWHESNILCRQPSENDDLGIDSNEVDDSNESKAGQTQVGGTTNSQKTLRIIGKSSGLAILFLIFMALGWKPFHSHLRTDQSSIASIFLEPNGRKSITLDFDTKEPQFATGVYMTPGQAYKVSAKVVNDWKDRTIPCDDADGFEPTSLHRWFAFTGALGPRLKHEPIFGDTETDDKFMMFTLLGSIGASGEVFKIGKEGSFRARSPGQLFLFVNDFPGFYGNNEGTAKVTIELVSATNFGEQQ